LSSDILCSFPQFSPADAATEGTARELSRLRQERGNNVSVRIARRELRAWLRSSNEGNRVEEAVSELLSG